MRTRPLLLVHPFVPGVRDAGPEKPASPPVLIDQPALSLSFCLPRTDRAARPRTYQVNVVYRRQMEAFAAEPDDDDRIQDE